MKRSGGLAVAIEKDGAFGVAGNQRREQRAGDLPPRTTARAGS
jgi:hypothetical protein